MRQSNIFVRFTSPISQICYSHFTRQPTGFSSITGRIATRCLFISFSRSLVTFESRMHDKGLRGVLSTNDIVRIKTASCLVFTDDRTVTWMRQLDTMCIHCFGFCHIHLVVLHRFKFYFISLISALFIQRSKSSLLPPPLPVTSWGHLLIQYWDKMALRYWSQYKWFTMRATVMEMGVLMFLKEMLLKL